MGKAKKAKVSVTISTDLLSQIDAFALDRGIDNRSQVIELWLRRAAREHDIRRLERDTIDYYERLTDSEVAEDAGWADASSGEFARLDLD